MRKGSIHKYVTQINYRDLDMYSVLFHPNYLALADNARNAAFAEFGYPVEEQLKDKVGFTVAEISNLCFKRPLFMGEQIEVFTTVEEVGTKSCVVNHRIRLAGSPTGTPDVFSANYKLVFVSIAEIAEFPLNSQNISGMRTMPFNEKVKANLGF